MNSVLLVRNRHESKPPDKMLACYLIGMSLVVTLLGCYFLHFFSGQCDGDDESLVYPLMMNVHRMEYQFPRVVPDIETS